MKNKISLLLLLVTLIFGSAKGAENLAAADSAYNGKDYLRAIELYTAAAESEGTSAGLLYNLGNAYFQMGDYGNAMLNWLRARRLAPGDSKINANIKYLQSRVEDANKAEQRGKRMKVTPDEESFFQSINASISQNTSSNAWAVWGAACFVLFVAAVAIYIFSRNVILRKVGFFGGMALLFLSVIFVIFSFMASKAQTATDTGVVVGYKVTLLTEPGKEADANKGGVLTKGSKVQILSEEVDAEGKVTWYKVRLNSDYIGWVSATDLEIV